jgi:hypothetical protein
MSNARASHVMLRLGRMDLQQHHFRSLFEELISVVNVMTLQIFLCEQVADSGVHKHYDIINAVLGTTCDFCLENGTSKLQKNDPELNVMRPNHAWAIQVDGLSELMISVARDVSHAFSFLPKRSVEQSIRSLSVLSKALARQRRHLEQFSVRRPTEIIVIVDQSDVCPDCAHPYTEMATEE